MIEETPQLYNDKIKKEVDIISKKRITWVHNILNGLEEQEFIIYKNEDKKDGFVLLPDL